MKKSVLFLISIVWIAGLMAPSLLSYCGENNALISVNINEEEPQKQEKKDNQKEKLVKDITTNLDQIVELDSSTSPVTPLYFTLDFYNKIPLPPPEFLV
ncbi:hypothetical protein [Zeaxanthinibacter enoshimensis]|uniref:hypothetical protein n=1 Tax=Zeaxanthinibacter enoshimensis TaxID=392009 RepID=UPI003563DA9E